MQRCSTSHEDAYASPAGELSVAVERLNQDLRSSFDLLAKRLETVRREVTRNLKSQAEHYRESVEEVPRQEVQSPLPEESEVQELPEALVEWHTERDRQDKLSGAHIASTRSSNFILAQEAEILTHAAWVELGTKTEQLLEETEVQRETLSTTAVSHADSAKSGRSFIGELDSHFLQICKNICKRMQPWHPHSLGRLAWDAGGVVLMLLDVVTLPIIIAWDLGIGTSTPGSTVLFLLFWISLIFWFVDIAVNFNTGVYLQGKLVLNRSTISKQYFTSWCLVDVLVVLLDVAIGSLTLSEDTSLADGMSSSTRALRSTRVFRALRTVRLLRLLRVSRFNTVIDSVAEGKQWFVLMSAIIKASIMILLVVHFLACAWFFAGRMVRETDDNVNSWIEVADAGNVSGITQYLHAVQWIVTPPAPPPVDPNSTWERFFILLINAICLIVLGTTLGYISEVLGQLRAVHSERRTKLLQVRKYLVLHRVSLELSARIVRFAEHKLQKAEAGQVIDMSLLTPTLQRELWASQRSKFIMVHPFLSLTFEAYPEIFASICGAARAQPYEENEVVFAQGENAVSMIITVSGSWMMTSRDKAVEEFSEVAWFSEAAIYAKVFVLASTLKAVTFGDAFHIGRDELINCVSASPNCTKSYCEYARAFIKELRKGWRFDVEGREKSSCSPREDTYFEAECSRRATHLNFLYQELHPDPKQMLSNLVADGEDIGAVTTPRNYPLDTEHVLLAWNTDDHKQSEDGSEDGSNVTDSTPDWVLQVLRKTVPAKELPALLQAKIPELHPARGIHGQLHQPVERERSESACLSVLALVMNDYESFTQPQGSSMKLHTEQWKELQRLVKWISPTPDELYAVMVLLAIRSIGKSKTLLQQLPPSAERPERAVLHLMIHYPDIVPSTERLSRDGYWLVEYTLRIHESFNLGQMIQGENVPGSLSLLAGMLSEKGQATHKFYVLFLLGLMSGLAGGQGSKYMTSSNATSVVACIGCLIDLTVSSPEAIYWNFIISRARGLSLPTRTPEDLVLARLACLLRMKDKATFRYLKDGWLSLDSKVRKTLMCNLLSDGMEQRAFVLEFLPQCIAHVMTSAALDLTALLEVIAELLDNLEAMLDASSDAASDKMIQVDLSDLVEFAAAVQSRYVFKTCIARCRVRLRNGRVNLTMTAENWNRINEPDSDMTLLARGVDELTRRVRLIEANTARNREDTHKDEFDEFVSV